MVVELMRAELRKSQTFNLISELPILMNLKLDGAYKI